MSFWNNLHKLDCTLKVERVNDQKMTLAYLEILLGERDGCGVMIIV